MQRAKHGPAATTWEVLGGECQQSANVGDSLRPNSWHMASSPTHRLPELPATVALPEARAVHTAGRSPVSGSLRLKTWTSAWTCRKLKPCESALVRCRCARPVSPNQIGLSKRQHVGAQWPTWCIVWTCFGQKHSAGVRALLYPSRKVIESGGAAPARTSAAARPRQTESRARWGDACVALGFRVHATRLEPTASFSIFEWWEGPGAGVGLECRILGHDSSALERLHGRVQSQPHSLASF